MNKLMNIVDSRGFSWMQFLADGIPFSSKVMMSDSTADLSVLRADPARGAASPLSTQVGGSHYKHFKIQPAEYIHANDIPFLEGNAIKYISRWRFKGGMADLDKAVHCIELLKELENGKANLPSNPV